MGGVQYAQHHNTELKGKLNSLRAQKKPTKQKKTKNIKEKKKSPRIREKGEKVETKKWLLLLIFFNWLP